MARKTILLETAFWDEFSECTHSLTTNVDGDDLNEAFERIKRWKMMYDFICRSSAFIDSPLPELAEKAKSDKWLMHMLKCNGDGKMELTATDESFPNLNLDDEFECEGDHNSVFFTANNYRSGARKHGVINISIDTIWNQENKFKDTGRAVRSDRGWNWRQMDILKETSNGMVIIDNFVLSPDRETDKCEVSYNLKELLRLILPDSCNELYQLSLFYFDGGDSPTVRKRHKKEFYESIKKYISFIRPHLIIEIELFPTIANGQYYHKDFHDRTILTNNVWIGSEAGFDLLRKDASFDSNARAIKTTTTHGLYLGFGNDAADWLEEGQANLIEDAKKCLKRYNYTTKNRILH